MSIFEEGHWAVSVPRRSAERIDIDAPRAECIRPPVWASNDPYENIKSMRGDRTFALLVCRSRLHDLRIRLKPALAQNLFASTSKVVKGLFPLSGGFLEGNHARSSLYDCQRRPGIGTAYRFVAP